MAVRGPVCTLPKDRSTRTESCKIRLVIYSHYSLPTTNAIYKTKKIKKCLSDNGGPFSQCAVGFLKGGIWNEVIISSLRFEFTLPQLSLFRRYFFFQEYVSPTYKRRCFFVRFVTGQDIKIPGGIYLPGLFASVVQPGTSSVLPAFAFPRHNKTHPGDNSESRTLMNNSRQRPHTVRFCVYRSPVHLYFLERPRCALPFFSRPRLSGLYLKLPVSVRFFAYLCTNVISVAETRIMVKQAMFKRTQRSLPKRRPQC